MDTIIDIHQYKGVTFNIYQASVDPEEDPTTPTYFYWERDDVAKDRADRAGRFSFLPFDTLEEAKQDAEMDIDGTNRPTLEMIEQAVVEIEKMLRRLAQPN
jgi:hypothetical protein